MRSRSIMLSTELTCNCPSGPRHQTCPKESLIKFKALGSSVRIVPNKIMRPWTISVGQSAWAETAEGIPSP